MSNEVKNWSPNQLRLIEWLATPPDLRTPPTQADLAQELGVREETVSRWKREPGLTDEAAVLSRSMIRSELPEIYGALVRSAKSGSFQHIKLALEVAGEHTETLNVNHGKGRSTADEIREIDGHLAELDAEIAALEAQEGGARQGQA